MPKVSIILTSFNHDKFIRQSIESILNQTYKNFELIIWDDASSDDSWNIIKSYDDKRIKSFRNAQCLRGGNINSAFEFASGEYIAIHHSDDIWMHKKLEKQVEFLDKNSDIGAVFTSAQAINERGENITGSNHIYENIFDQKNRSRYEWLNYFFFNGNALCHPSILIRKSCYENCGLYRPGLVQLGDLDMWVRLCSKYEIYIMPERLIQFRVLDNEMNASGNNLGNRIRSQFELQKILQLYKNIVSNDEIFKIFPSFIYFNRGENTDPEYILARVCLESEDSYLKNYLAIEILFECLNDPLRSKNIENNYGFYIRDFVKINGLHDLFSREETIKLKNLIHEKNLQVNNFITKIESEIKDFISERDVQVNNLENLILSKNAQIRDLMMKLSSPPPGDYKL